METEKTEKTESERSPEPLCDICGIERAPFLRYGTVDRTGRMCAACLRRTRACDRCGQTRPTTALAPTRFVHGATGPGWAEYACRSCASAELLRAVGLHGYKYAIDATVAEVALRQPGPVAMLTSDVDDMVRLCGDRVRLVGV
jgi:hypothetical protein